MELVHAAVANKRPFTIFVGQILFRDAQEILGFKLKKLYDCSCFSSDSPKEEKTIECVVCGQHFHEQCRNRLLAGNDSGKPKMCSLPCLASNFKDLTQPPSGNIPVVHPSAATSLSTSTSKPMKRVPNPKALSKRSRSLSRETLPASKRAGLSTKIVESTSESEDEPIIYTDKEVDKNKDVQPKEPERGQQEEVSPSKADENEEAPPNDESEEQDPEESSESSEQSDGNTYPKFNLNIYASSKLGLDSEEEDKEVEEDEDDQEVDFTPPKVTSTAISTDKQNSDMEKTVSESKNSDSISNVTLRKQRGRKRPAKKRKLTDKKLLETLIYPEDAPKRHDDDIIMPGDRESKDTRMSIDITEHAGGGLTYHEATPRYSAED